ncbi:hypothetical protein CEUSTIGMA_g3160.t1 [Chlamydomonas eustigma]|uniref:Uncharacterized protein n=1 Tax=Chlamydomonas eustigma TaxID=1157962 RepID=A0A250WY08_9CHLO|nr:hypothetical protein CEUSTIGMA_g3160.t1 [Chlamydomonas eustigma]|eukprot:GAX75717.1 hypothetical protein CEUSTIGMA_g3160.t1 [Chlamydomonas eustigma]
MRENTNGSEIRLNPTKWLRNVQSLGLLLHAPYTSAATAAAAVASGAPAQNQAREDTSAEQKGVSLALIYQLSKTLLEHEEQGALSDRSSTSTYMGNIVLPALQKFVGKIRLLDLVPKHQRGQPQWYVSHAWKGSFEDLVDALTLLTQQLLVAPRGKNQEISAASVTSQCQDIYVWIGSPATC